MAPAIKSLPAIQERRCGRAAEKYLVCGSARDCSSSQTWGLRDSDQAVDKRHQANQRVSCYYVAAMPCIQPVEEYSKLYRQRIDLIKWDTSGHSDCLGDLFLNTDSDLWTKSFQLVLDRAKATESQTVEILRGKVNRIVGDVAHVTLTDDRGRETFADCSVAELLAHGIRDETRFECIIQDRGMETVVTLQPVQERELSRSEWKRLSNQVEKALADYSIADDY